MKIMPSASLTPPLFIEMPVPSQESEQRCIGVLEVSIFLLDLELFRQRYYFLFISLLSYKGPRGRDRIGFITVLITAKFVSLNPVHGEVYSTICDKVCQ